jgi:ribokinase
VLRVVVVGGINIDELALVDREPDDDNPAVIAEIASSAGGKGANQAVAAARLGCSVTLVGAVGSDDAGGLALQALTDAGIDCAAVRRLDGEPTGRVIGMVTTAGGKRTAALGGANVALTEADVDLSPIDGCDLVLCQLELATGIVRAALRRAQAAGVPALLDMAPAQGDFAPLVPLARWVTGNRSEVRAATGVRVEDEPSARKAAAALLATGPQLAGVTAGARGQLVAWTGGEAWCPVDRSVPVVDTSGAGDAFAATLGVALASGVEPAHAAALASRASTLTCRALGAQTDLPTREELGWPWS